MKQHTPACALPSQRRPEGRTGTPAGYLAHRRAGEAVCEPCATAQSTYSATPRGALTTDELAAGVAFVCLRSTKKYPNGRQGTEAGHSAHKTAKEDPCDACRLAHNAATKIRMGKYADRKKNWPSLSKENLAFKSIWQKYRVTKDRFYAMLRSQNGVCAICGTEKADGRGTLLHVDHDHSCCPGGKSCGKCVRGLLCARCNAGLGAFSDDPDRLMSAAAYLLRTKNILTEVKSDAADQAGGGAPEEAGPAWDAAS